MDSVPPEVLQYIQQCEQEDRAQLAGIDFSRPTDNMLQDNEPHAPRAGPRQVFIVSNGLVKGCGVPTCTKTASLSRCSACKAVSYCGHDHQALDRQRHRFACNKVKKTNAHLEKVERALRRTEGEDIFVAGRGHFWGILETRDYMRARYSVVQSLTLIHTEQAVQQTLDQLLDMLQLCRADNMGVRDVVPSLYVRLGRDQECYDFCTWWATNAQDQHYRWGDLDEPYLDTKDVDVFGPVALFSREFGTLSHGIAVMLIKIRLIIDLQSLQRAHQDAGPHVPQEILEEIKQKSITTSIANRADILESDDHTARIMELKAQVKELYTATQKANEHFWPALVNPGVNLEVLPSIYTHGGKGEMRLILQYHYNAWRETPGAIDVVEALVKRRF